MHGDEPTVERVWTKHLLPLRDASGSITGVIITAQEFTAQRQSPDPTFEPSERAAFLLRLSDALQSQLDADRVYYAEVEADAEHATITFDEGSLEPHERTAHQALGVSATLAYPLLIAGRLVGLLVAHSGSKRTWEALERSRSETAVRLSEARLRSTLDRLPASVWVSDPNGNVELINQRWYEYSGATPDQVTIALTSEEWVHPEDASRVMAGKPWWWLRTWRSPKRWRE